MSKLSDFSEGQWWVKETGDYYCPEGWYEWNQNEEMHWAVSETPRAWCELPQTLQSSSISRL